MAVTVKRIVDVVLSTIILIIVSPVLFVSCVLIACCLGSPVIFQQARMGRYGDDFWIYKLRTMTDQRDQFGRLLPDHLRTTAFGDFLRKWSIDELPQFINVLIGNMSIVGPRPLMHKYLAHCTAEQLRRQLVPPGITGFAQIKGRKGLDYERRFEFDIEYVDNWNLLLDLKISLATFSVLVGRGGAEETGKELPARFTGSEYSEEEEDNKIIRVI